MPELVQVGNETNGEILSTLERAKQPIDWTRNAKLFNAGIRAVATLERKHHQAARHAAYRATRKCRAMVCRGEGGGRHRLRSDRHQLLSALVDRDHRWLGTHVIRNLRQSYPADVLVVEAAYPWTLENADRAGNLLGTSTLIAGYPATPRSAALPDRHHATNHLQRRRRVGVLGTGVGVEQMQDALGDRICMG